MSFTPIGNTLYIKDSPEDQAKKQLEAAQVLEHADNTIIELFGKEKAYHIRPLFLKNRTLTISCATSLVAQEIRDRQAEIVDKINEKMGKKEVDSIRYLA
ncbi:MAG: hypothetical protein A2469_02400 [Candidatus Magasanikbacteria bacterium RIFOXYC2_FULL_40_16]|uniref:Uncharacterized protein n=3 Tax=Candidatus Magasanikiibacteriota TaxID=1752731 RepID=A0A1F6NIT4_9BACT|nr:MAG: hypothetical protein A2224_01550 [Candidatus Magasanikbacteria bacterium RIFOXYA2_FULL_40_20]OGH83867.1 MAG: hypothetical protein A2373_01985 [Candidatus Magasanikbacteria bacterium RIFOXYB1_FULL_40_15]OGH86341.1 MAG: hypothetical protein A2301_00035 [Candidatus Magasanikbacteria bacterium RIFOXYB2_FULL_40_13]OGH87138.1 MAG: hypothetical protein A2206_00675 [Candidatus Magasanikbacteria bacterium RIFOXYA1_FULL_40_8]OGH89646.1 MAG: hypothetical protein A2469_02400 [Candidatus Magasanikba